MSKLLIGLIVIGVLILLLYFFFQIKKLKLPCVYLVTGAVKTGKSFLSIYLAISKYNLAILRYLIQCALRTLLHKDLDEMPLIYSNIPLKNIIHSRLTLDVINRKVRIPNKSIVLIDEASLLADSMSYKDDLINERITLFVKLFGHYSHGGFLIINTQSLQDMHFGFKRCINNYLLIHSRRKLPFITTCKVRELMYSDDNNNITNVFNEDIEASMKLLFVPNKYYKYYDCYCYSIFTDDLVYYNEDLRVLKKRKDLKASTIVSFRDFKTLKEYANE